MISAPKGKSFWQKPEGNFGKVFLLAAVAAAAVGVFKFLPMILGFIAAVLHSALLAALSFAGLMVLWLVFTDKTVKELIGFGFQGTMRALTYWLVGINPISTMKSYVQKLKQELGLADNKIGEVEGEIAKFERIIHDNETEATDAEDSYRVAQKKGNTSKQIDNLLIKSQSLRDSNERLGGELSRMQGMCRILHAMRDESDVAITRLSDEIRIREVERNAMTSSASTMQSLVKIFKGDPNSKQIYDAAMERTINDIDARIGDIRNLMKISSDYMESSSLKNDVLKDKALKRLDEWNKNKVGAPLQIAGSSAQTLLKSDRQKAYDAVFEKR
jgi:hypothetical protein